MATEAERFLRKARESLASARADLRAKRYNSCANRAYYACFQAAVAALIHWRERSWDADWEHRFVSEEFALRLIRRRKVFASDHADVLNDLFSFRIIGDYRDRDVSEREAQYVTRRAERLVSVVASKIGAREAREATPEYEVAMRTKTRDPEACVEQVRQAILQQFPDVEITSAQRAPRDFTLDVWGIDDDRLEGFHWVSKLATDILVDDDVWIVVLPMPRREASG